jgi:methylmalonyl-CoA mutase
LPQTVKTALIRSSDEDKKAQVTQIADLNERFGRYQAEAIRQLKRAATHDQNVFEALMETTKVCSLGQISQALYEVGGAYRRNL